MDTREKVELPGVRVTVEVGGGQGYTATMDGHTHDSPYLGGACISLLAGDGSVLPSIFVRFDQEQWQAFAAKIAEMRGPTSIPQDDPDPSYIARRAAQIKIQPPMAYQVFRLIENTIRLKRMAEAGNKGAQALMDRHMVEAEDQAAQRNKEAEAFFEAEMEVLKEAPRSADGQAPATTEATGQDANPVPDPRDRYEGLPTGAALREFRQYFEERMLGRAWPVAGNKMMFEDLVRMLHETEKLRPHLSDPRALDAYIIAQIAERRRKLAATAILNDRLNRLFGV